MTIIIMSELTIASLVTIYIYIYIYIYIETWGD